MASLLPEERFFRSGSSEEIWQHYCGFLDLSVSDFMEIQNYLLLAQMRRVANTPVSRAIMNGAQPTSVDEFRQKVPLTTYTDYAPYLEGRQEDGLAEKPYFWCHSAGRGGNFKWIPYTKEAFDYIARYAVATGILSGADAKGEVNVTPGERVLVNLAPRPYASGSLMYYLTEYFPYKSIPPTSQAESPDFRERTAAAFRLALEEGVDYIFSTSTVLGRIAESFGEQGEKVDLRGQFGHPRVLRRLFWGWLRSRLARRQLMPKDLWSPKGLITFGVDTAIYEKAIAKLWGRVPYQVYGTTEMIICAVQSWNKGGLIFLPDVAFWEFIPQEEWEKNAEDASYRPATVLLNELEVGKQYEVVYSHFHGMPLMRYRIGDVIKVVALEQPEVGVKLPQVVFQARTSEIIDLSGLTQIDERTLWQAIADTGVKYEEWCARRGYRNDLPCLNLYLELKEERSAEDLEEMLEQKLRAADADFRDLESWLGQRRAVCVEFLSPGTFKLYYEEKLKEGATLAQLRPPHINPSESSVARLVQLSNTLAGGA